MLAASVLAGELWDRLGPGVTFYAGAIFASGGPVDACAAKRALTFGLTQYRFAFRRQRFEDDL